MKCKACLSDNVNEATYCKNCGKDIASTYHVQQKSKALTVIFVCIVVVVAMFVIVGIRWNYMFRTIDTDAAFRESVTEDYQVYYSPEQKATYIHKGQADVRLSDKRLRLVEYFDDRNILLKGGSEYYYYNGNAESGALALDNLKEYSYIPEIKSLVYLSGSGSMYFVNASYVTRIAEIAGKVTSCMAPNGENPDGKVFYIEENSNSIKVFYGADYLRQLQGNPGTMELTGYHGTEGAFPGAERIINVIPNNKEGNNIFYVTSDKVLKVSGSGKDHAEAGFCNLLGTTALDVAFSTNDGTYVWFAMDYGVEDAPRRIASFNSLCVCTPEGYDFSTLPSEDKDKKDLICFYNKIYLTDKNCDGQGDGLVYISEDGNSEKKLCEDMNINKVLVSRDSTIAYYTDMAKNLYISYATLNMDTKLCCGDVDDFAIGADSREIYYLSKGDLYHFDGYKSILVSKHGKITPEGKKKEVNAPYSSINLDRYGNYVIKSVNSKNKLRAAYWFDGKKVEMLIRQNAQGTVELARNGLDFYIVNGDNVIKTLREDGAFRTDNEQNEASKSDTSNSEG